jgi:hypothetical protein
MVEGSMIHVAHINFHQTRKQVTPGVDQCSGMVPSVIIELLPKDSSGRLFGYGSGSDLFHLRFVIAVTAVASSDLVNSTRNVIDAYISKTRIFP